MVILCAVSEPLTTPWKHKQKCDGQQHTPQDKVYLKMIKIRLMMMNYYD